MNFKFTKVTECYKTVSDIVVVCGNIKLKITVMELEEMGKTYRASDGDKKKLVHKDQEKRIKRKTKRSEK